MGNDMVIAVKVVAGAKRVLVKEEGAGLKVYVRAPAVDGKANEALLEVLAGHFGVKKKQVVIVRGHTSRAKLIKILSGLP